MSDRAVKGVWPSDGLGVRARPEKISTIVARQITESIAVNGLADGIVLPSENSMLAQYNIGRGSLREALRILEEFGLISIRPGRHGGPVVSTVTPGDFAKTTTFFYFAKQAKLSHLLETKAVIEPIVARLASQRPKHERQAFAQFINASVDIDDEQEYSQKSGEFHDLLAQSSNPVLYLFCASLRWILVDRLSPVIVPPTVRPDMIHDHAEIAQAILDGDGERAERLTAEHAIKITRWATRRFPGLLDDPVRWY